MNTAAIDKTNGFVYFGTGYQNADETYTEFNNPGVIIQPQRDHGLHPERQPEIPD